ncbi:MAG: peptide chain release factor 2 [Opitutales bacterium]|nr:peptide chain release factor 2 [Opitutales bacterium]MCH8540610.1 peptide chain release factor 2 [Opitutales bacterium]
MIQPEIRSQIEEITKRAGYLWRYLDVPTKQKEIAAIEAKMSEPTFWDNPDGARKIIDESNRLKALVNPVVDFYEKVRDLEAMVELIDEASEGETDDEEKELAASVAALGVEMDKIEIKSFLTGPHDHCNAILSIHAGAGGTESCDWADMLFRMYTRWAERSGYKVEIQDMIEGEEAGLNKVTMLISGENAYGYARAERGVHRLVRISPFDSNARRHTSFCSVDVIAEIEDDIEIDIQDDDLRIDTYRSSGKGGQHVNKTDSAVRITHMPSGIVVACQNERSQLKNKNTAMKVLKARLYEKIQDEKKAEMERFYGEKGEIGWGNQIRSYVFQPYQMIKDLRTGHETGNLQQVVDGDLDPFIHAWLRAGKPMTRSKEVAVEE